MNLEFKKKFIENFAKEIDQSLIEKYVLDNGFPWHIFSFDLKDKNKYLSGAEAQKKYDQIEKNDTLVYLYFEEKEIKINNKYKKSSQLFKCIEVYVYPKDFSWCYIKTHECDEDYIDDEESYGPYFVEK